MKILVSSVLVLVAAGTAVAQDQLVKVTVSDVVVKEGAFGETAKAVFHVRLGDVAATPVTLGYATESVTASAPADYQATSGALVIDGGQDGDIEVNVKGDFEAGEGNEAFLLRLTFTSANALIIDGIGYGVISDDDLLAAPHSRCDLGHKGRTSLMAMYDPDHGEEEVLRHNPEHQPWGPNAGLVEPGGPLLLMADTSPRWEIQAMEDFDGNGTCDVLWRHGSAQLATFTPPGEDVHTPLNTEPTYPVPAIQTDWRVVGSGRFDEDAIADILWFSPTAQPRYQVWLGPPGTTSPHPTLGNWPTNLEPIAVADLAGTGGAGIIWRDAQGGLSYSTVRHFGVAPPVAIAREAGDMVTVEWKLGAVGDFDGDGYEDIAWQDGEMRVAVWFMHGPARRGELLMSPEKLMLANPGGPPQAGELVGPR